MKTLKSVFILMFSVSLALAVFMPNAVADDTGGGGISITQAISDEAQGNTIAFDGLAFLTGDLCSNTFLPPGKVADFSGFQYLRDTDPTNMGHNTEFVTIIAYNILNILTDAQRTTLLNLAQSQIDQISQYGYNRLPLVKAFVRLLTGDIPTGSTGLVRSKVMAYSASDKLYQLDGLISFNRAKTLGSILRGMTTTQKAQLDALVAKNGIGNWDKTLTDPMAGLHLEPAVSVAVMTYASEMYSWYAGGVEADTYFCPERQGTYFGSFYMKDIPAMTAGTSVTIPDTLTADVGSDFLNLLTTDQKALITGLVDIQRNDLYEIVSTRRLIATQLRRFITESLDETAIAALQTTVLNLAKRYGELDGEIVYNYANHFVAVSKSLNNTQKSGLLPILAKYSWSRVACTMPYLYSEQLSAWPDIESYHSTDDFFTTDTAAAPYAWFGFSPNAPTTSTTVSFTDASSGSPTSWLWDFGDGSTGTAQNPTHTFAAANTYTVTLRATNINGSGSSSRSITVTSGGSGLAGDVNGDGNVNLTDAILALHILSGITVTETINQNADVNGDKKIGIEELLYSLQNVSVLRSSSGTSSSFTLTSDVGTNGGALPVEYSCNGAGSSIALSWTNVPAGTKEFALMMTTIPVDGSTKWNWVLYGIPATATGLAKNSSGVGTLGLTSDGPNLAYYPPCPQGPGPKLYTFTVYALSASPTLPAANQVTGAVLTNAISSIMLGSASLSLSYTR